MKNTDTKEAKPFEFEMPEGLTVPEGAVPGEEFEMVASFEWEEDGKTLCLKAIGGIPVGPAGDEPEGNEGSDEGTFAETVASKFQGVM